MKGDLGPRHWTFWWLSGDIARQHQQPITYCIDVLLILEVRHCEALIGVSSSTTQLPFLFPIFALLATQYYLASTTIQTPRPGPARPNSSPPRWDAAWYGGLVMTRIPRFCSVIAFMRAGNEICVSACEKHSIGVLRARQGRLLVDSKHYNAVSTDRPSDHRFDV
jgi:hypothetical protein